MTDIRKYIKENILLFDGAMGTYYTAVSKKSSMGCEKSNLNDPELIAKIHREYLEAGAKAIKTNTFAVNSNTAGSREAADELIAAAWKIAKAEAAAKEAFVFADMGPLSQEIYISREDVAEEMKAIANSFLQLGASNFLFETFSNSAGLAETIQFIREQCPEAFIMTSFAVQTDGFSRDGIYMQKLIARAAAAGTDAVGLNCVCGASHMAELIVKADSKDKLLSAMPNAGYPIVVNQRTVYDGSPEYYADNVREMLDNGVHIIGGCCGTTPAHIRELRKMLDQYSGKTIRIRPQKAAGKSEKEKTKETYFNPFWEKLTGGRKPVAVELDPPDSFSYDRFMGGAWELKNAGTDIITIADCPIARARMDSSILACKIHRDMSLDALPHMTCRDRNINATKALLFGVYAEGIRNVLLVTGDPITTAERDEVKTVFQYNSRKLAAYVQGLNEEMFPEPMHIFGALNLNARNFDVQLRLAKEKLENGMAGFLTQPVLTETALENLKRVKKELDCYVLGGIMPVVSARNARYMDSEINGINVAPEIIKMYEGLTKQQAEEKAVELSLEIAGKIEPYVDGYYIMTPFNKTGLVSRIVSGIKSSQTKN